MRLVRIRQWSNRAALSLALLLIVLPACAPQGSGSSEPITLTFACQRSDLTVYQDAAETFHQANPSIEIRVIPLDDIVSFPLEDETDTLGPVRQLASHADTFLWTTDAVEGGPPGLVLDLSSFIQADGEPAETDFLPGLLAHFQGQGGTWGLPAGVDPLFILYDQAAFEAAGLAYPSPGWTWDNLFDAAQQLTQREEERVVRYGFADFGLGSVRSAVEAQGGQLVDDSAEPPVPTLSDPRTVAAVQWYTDLALTREAMANPTEEKFADSFGVVQQGKAAMSVTLGQIWVAKEHEGKLGIAPLPGSSPVWLYGYFVSAGTAHPEAAWRWLQFLSRQVAPPDRLPAYQSLIPGSAYASAAGEEALEAFRYAAEHALPPLHPAAVEVLLQQAVERVFEGEETEGALAEAQGQALSLPTPGVGEPFAVPSPVPAEAAMETIIFVAFYPPQDYAALAEAFHESHPDIKVVVRNPADFDHRGGPPAEMIEASNADCFETPYPAYAPALRQAALNLQPFVDADPAFPLDDYLPWALEDARYGGDLWGLPAGVNVDVLWYNRTLFDEANLPYPEGRWSWNDVFLTARRLAGGEEGDQRYGIVIWPDIRGLSLLEAIGGSLVDESAAPPTFRFDAPEVVAAARQLRSLVQDEIVPIPEQAEGYSQDLYTLILANRIGMWADRSRGFDDQDFDFHPVPLPQPGRCHSSSSSAYYIAADTSNAKVCWEWLRFLSEHLPPVNFHLPPRRSLLTSDVFREQVGADAQAAYLETLECKEWGWLSEEGLPPYAGRAYTWLEQALDEILWHGTDAQATLSEAQRKAEAYLECLRQRTDLQDQASADACFQEVDAP